MSDSNKTSSIEVAIDDLKNNGIDDLPSVPYQVTTTAFEPSEFEADQQGKESTSIPEFSVPGLIVHVREGVEKNVFRVFSLIPCVSDRERVFEIMEGTAETADEARAQCLRKTSAKMQGEAQAVTDYLKERAATDAATEFED